SYPPEPTLGYGQTARLHGKRAATPLSSMTQAQLLDQSPVPLNILLPQVIQQTPALADHLVQAAPRVVVLLVHLEVLGQLFDPVSPPNQLWDTGRPPVYMGKERQRRSPQ